MDDHSNSVRCIYDISHISGEVKRDIVESGIKPSRRTLIVGEWIELMDDM